MITKASPLNLKFTKEKGEVKEGKITLTEVDRKADIDQTAEIDTQDHYIDIGLNVDRILEDKTLEEETQRSRKIQRKRKF